MSKQFYKVLVFDYQPFRDKESNGVIIDSWFTKAKSIGVVRQEIFDKYSGAFSRTIALEKPIDGGFYAKTLVVDESIYNHEKEEIDDFCFCCEARIKGRKASLPSTTISFGSSYDEDYEDEYHLEDTDEATNVFFCSHECKQNYFHALNPAEVPSIQKKEVEQSGTIFGYIYHIYNRVENIHYVGQTRFYPTSRWQEHIKSLKKGTLTQLEFSVIAEIPKCENAQQLLNDTEAWWIGKYQEEGYEVFNLVQPKMASKDFKERYEAIKHSAQTSLF